MWTRAAVTVAVEEGGVAWRCRDVVQVWLGAIRAKGLRLSGVEWQAACEVQPWHGACSGPGLGPHRRARDGVDLGDRTKMGRRRPKLLLISNEPTQ